MRRAGEPLAGGGARHPPGALLAPVPLEVAHAIRQGHWCKKCADERLRFPLQAVKDVAAARGGACLSDYSNSQTKLEWQCGSGHSWWATFSSVKKGSWCPQFKGEKRARRRINGSAMAHTIDMIQKAAPPSSA